MEYNLENKILLVEESELKTLYPWSLQEFDKLDKKVGTSKIPCIYSLYFTASELRLNYSIDHHKPKEPSDKDADASPLCNEKITGILHSGICRDGKSLKDEVFYSMFGTHRRIDHFILELYKSKDSNDKPKCHLVNFRDVTEDDLICVFLTLSEEQFNMIAKQIRRKTLDILEFFLSGVSGFYSDWSPEPKPGSINILTNTEEHKVILKDDCKINPPRLGDVDGFYLSITQRLALNPKQNLQAINIDQLFEKSEERDKINEVNVDNVESMQDVNSSTPPSLTRNETALKMLSIPLWLIFIILCLLLIK